MPQGSCPQWVPLTATGKMPVAPVKTRRAGKCRRVVTPTGTGSCATTRRGIDLTHRRSFRGCLCPSPKVPGLYDQSPRSLRPNSPVSRAIRRASLGVFDARRTWRPNGEFCYAVGGVLYPKGAIMELKTLRGSWPCAFTVLRHGNNVLLERKAGENPYLTVDRTVS